jgi:hypothetical protein
MASLDRYLPRFVRGRVPTGACALAFPLRRRVAHERSGSRPATIGAAHPHLLHFNFETSLRKIVATPRWSHRGACDR